METKRSLAKTTNSNTPVNRLRTACAVMLLPLLILLTLPNSAPAFSYPTNATLLWQLQLTAQIHKQPVIAPDGTIYISQYAGAYSPVPIWAINPNGSIKWQTNMARGGAGGIASDVDGTVYWLGDNGSGTIGLHALNSTNGGTIWLYPGAWPCCYAPAIGPDGTIYVNNGSQILAITNGLLKWVYPTNSSSQSPFTYCSAVVGPDGTIYAPDINNNIYALNPNGTLKWMKNGFTQPQGTGLALDSGGIIYTVSSETNANPFYLTALMPDGTIKWQCTPPTNFCFGFTPEIGPDGTVYAATYYSGNSPYNSQSDLLLAITPDGTIKWIFPLDAGGLYDGSPCAIASDGEIYVTSSANGIVYSLAPNGTINWAYQTSINSGGLKAPIIGPDGTIYVAGSNDDGGNNLLLAFYGPAPIACGQWPEFRGNSRGTAAFATTPMSSPKMQTNGFQFTISGISNMPVCLCASSDLENWTNIGQTILTGGSTNFVDIRASNYPHRFYRALPQ
jgi:outer membrane protein assembly factor BamB